MKCVGCYFYRFTLFIILFGITVGTIWMFNNSLKFWESVGLIAVAYMISAWYILSIKN